MLFCSVLNLGFCLENVDKHLIVNEQILNKYMKLFEYNYELPAFIANLLRNY